MGDGSLCLFFQQVWKRVPAWSEHKIAELTDLGRLHLSFELFNRKRAFYAADYEFAVVFFGNAFGDEIKHCTRRSITEIAGFLKRSRHPKCMTSALRRIRVDAALRARLIRANRNDDPKASRQGRTVQCQSHFKCGPPGEAGLTVSTRSHALRGRDNLNEHGTEVQDLAGSC
jgi:hypothetical protein